MPSLNRSSSTSPTPSSTEQHVPLLPHVQPRTDSSSSSGSPSPHGPTGKSSTQPPALLQLALTYIPPAWHPLVTSNYGLLLVSSSQFFFASMSLTVKYFLAATDISTLMLITVRMGATAVFSIFFLWWNGDPHWLLGPPEVRRQLLVRGLCGFLGLFSSYEAYKGLKVSDVLMIQFLEPTVIAIIAFLLLGEVLRKRELAAGFASLLGTLLVSRPPALFGATADGNPSRATDGPEDRASAALRTVSIGWAFFSVFAASSAYVTIRAIGTRAHAMHSMIYFSYFCVILCSISLLLQSSPVVFINTFAEFLLIILIGIFGFTGQTLLTMGLQAEKAGRASIAIYTSVCYTLALELIFFQTLPALLSLLGLAVILSSAAVVAWSGSKAPSPKPESEADSLPLAHTGNGYSPLPLVQPAAPRSLVQGSSLAVDGGRSTRRRSSASSMTPPQPKQLLGEADLHRGRLPSP